MSDDLPEVMVINGERYIREYRDLRVSVHGMYDCHLFTRYDGATPEAIVEAWLAENANPHERYGTVSLCPVCVLDGTRELRRVGPMIHYDYATKKSRDPTPWLVAVNADPDIRRLLAEGKGKQPDQGSGAE